MKIKQALAVTFAERYFAVAAQFIVTAVVARILTPDEFGVVAIGLSILGIMETIRDFGISNYLVQRKDLTRAAARTGFTVIAFISIVISLLLLAAAGPIAGFYGEPRLVPYIQVMAAVALTGMFASPLMALMRRDMAFTTLAAVNLSNTLIVSVVTIVLATLDFSYMSYAWAGLAGSLTYAILAMICRPDFWVFMPAFQEWRSALAFGSYSSLSDTLSRSQDLLSYLILGRLMPTNAVGLFNRAVFISTVPVKLLTVGVMPVALPGFAAEARAERELKRPYLRALSLMTAVLWPALITLAFLAHPAVLIVLGDQWLATVPIIQLLALAALWSAPMPLNFPILSAAGRVKEAAWLGLMVFPVYLVTLLVAAPFGLKAVAWGIFITMPLRCGVWIWLIRRYVGFSWAEFFSALRRGAVVSLYSAAIPAIAIAAHGFRFEISITLGVVIGFLTSLGWFGALWITRHPLFDEVQSVMNGMRRWMGHFRFMRPQRHPPQP